LRTLQGNFNDPPLQVGQIQDDFVATCEIESAAGADGGYPDGHLHCRPGSRCIAQLGDQDVDDLLCRLAPKLLQ
jgi:hypothetical protein